MTLNPGLILWAAAWWALILAAFLAAWAWSKPGRHQP